MTEHEWLAVLVSVLGLCAGLAFVAGIASRLRRRVAARVEAASRPAALRRAQLRYLETVFRIRGPIPLVARLDRAYRQVDGSLVLVELKTRRSGRAHLSDVIQLSAQRMALQGQTGERVLPVAYVSFPGPAGEAGCARDRSQRVTLLAASDLVALYRRREDILAGRVRPTYSQSPNACARCAFREDCDSPTTAALQRRAPGSRGL